MHNGYRMSELDRRERLKPLPQVVRQLFRHNGVLFNTTAHKIDFDFGLISNQTPFNDVSWNHPIQQPNFITWLHAGYVGS